MLFVIILPTLAITPYQSVAMDLIVNSYCMLLSFKVLDTQYKCWCKSCIWCSDKCSKSEGDSDEKGKMKEMEMKDRSRVISTTEMSSPTSTGEFSADL